MKYFLYTRKSSEEEERQVLSLQSQLAKARELFPDLDIIELPPESASAFKPDNRPIFADMLKRIDAGEAHGIIAWHPDRLSRNELDAAAITYRLRTGVIQDLKFGSFTFDNSPEGVMMLQMTMSQSQYFSSKLSKDVKRGYETKLELGWKPGAAPAGYLNVGELKGHKTIEPDPERFELIERTFRLMLTGNYTVPQALDKLNNEWGFRTRISRSGKSGDKPLSRSALYAILINPFYYGCFYHSGKLVNGSHKPMITTAEFDRIQTLLGRKGRPRPKTHSFAFTGIMQCGECGCVITAETKVKYLKKTAETREYTYYHCTHKRPCAQRSITEAELVKQVDLVLQDLTILPEFRDWALDVLHNSSDSEIAQRAEIQRSQSAAVLKKQHEVDNLTSMRVRDLITDEEYLETKERLTSELRRLQEALRDTEERAGKWLELTEQVFDFATNARSKFSNGTDEERRAVFTALGGSLTLKDQQVNIELYPYLVPIKEQYPSLQGVFDNVRTGKSANSKVLLPANVPECSQWLPVGLVLRTKYYQSVVKLYREIEIAQDYLGTSGFSQLTV